MNSIIEEYIQQNKLCTEYLFPDWNNFLKILYENNGQVEAILWFEYILINQQKYSLGSGGYIDKKNPEYMYAETQIYNDGFENKKIEEIVDYIQTVISKYPNNNLMPAFYIAE